MPPKRTLAARLADEMESRSFLSTAKLVQARTLSGRPLYWVWFYHRMARITNLFNAIERLLGNRSVRRTVVRSIGSGVRPAPKMELKTYRKVKFVVKQEDIGKDFIAIEERLQGIHDTLEYLIDDNRLIAEDHDVSEHDWLTIEEKDMPFSGGDSSFVALFATETQLDLDGIENMLDCILRKRFPLGSIDCYCRPEIDIRSLREAVRSLDHPCIGIACTADSCVSTFFLMDKLCAPRWSRYLTFLALMLSFATPCWIVHTWHDWRPGCFLVAAFFGSTFSVTLYSIIWPKTKPNPIAVRAVWQHNRVVKNFVVNRILYQIQAAARQAHLYNASDNPQGTGSEHLTNNPKTSRHLRGHLRGISPSEESA